MTVQQMDEDEAASLRAAPLTYSSVAPLLSAGSPEGYSSFARSRTLTRRDFDAAVRDLYSWRMHERSGLRLRASDVPLREGTVVLMRLGPGPLSVRIPCRVVRVADEPHQRGFTYGTLPGHPESGEEQFTLTHEDDGSIRFTVSAFSRPATRIARWGGPLGRAVQDRMTSRYLQALDRIS